MRWVVPVAAATLGGILAVASPARADSEIIELKDGHQVVGEVVAEKPNFLFVDLGFDIVRVPRDQVVSRRKGNEAARVAASPAGSAADVDPTGLYKTGDLKATPVKDLVRRFGEAVISIETPSGKGSGFILNDEGFAVTNHHVIDGETRISAILYENTPVGLRRRRIDDVAIVALNPFVDLALLKLPPQKDLKLGHVYLGSLDDLNAGDGVFAVGNPMGLERSVSQGIVSTRNRNFEGLVYLQTDTAINPGNSGGPLFNLRGEVIGVTNMKLTLGENLGFAIPITYVKDFLRNREAFSFDKDNPNTGHRYLDPPRRLRAGPPPGRSSVPPKAESGRPAGESR
jgi:serine protease Do